jgi:RHS repeat-associated protein
MFMTSLSYSYDAVGHLLTAIDPSSRYTYTYDLVDRLASIDNTGTSGVPAVKLSYGYDAVGNTVTVGDSIANVSAGLLTYTYDVLNRATSISQTGTAVQNKHVDMTYNAISQVTKLSRFRGASSAVETTYGYDGSQRLTQIAHKQGSTLLAGYDYTYDGADRITRIVSSVDGATDYNYDSTNQLTGADHSSQTDEAYSYDANGNRTSSGYQTDSNNQMLSDGTYTYEYDGEGNRTKRVAITSGETTEYVWDYRNRLAQVVLKNANGAVTKNIEYTYDVNNVRIGKRIDGVVTERYIIDRNQISLVFNGSSSQTHRYLYGTEIDQVLADDTSTSMVWSLADHQGTVRDLADGDGAVIDHITYDSFGQVLTQTSNIDIRFAYTGREWDRETGQYYYRARYYDAAAGKFTSEDPLEFEAGDTNLSRYVSNNSPNLVDQTGNKGVPVRPVNRPIPRNRPTYPGTRQPGINPSRPTVPRYSFPPQTCITSPGVPCYTDQNTDPIVGLERFSRFSPSKRDRFRRANEDINTLTCNMEYDIGNELEIPFRERHNWPAKCQLDFQLSPRPNNPDGDGMCVYICRDWGPKSPIIRRIAPGLNCPQWFDWVPDRIE